MNGQENGTAGQEFRYAMVNRPAGFATAPKGIIRTEDRPAEGLPHHDMARNGVAVYDRQLTPEETTSFEMAPMLGTLEEMEPYAVSVATRMARYARGYLEMANDDPGDFAAQVFDKLNGASEGYRPSIGNKDAFVSMVKFRLATFGNDA